MLPEADGRFLPSYTRVVVVAVAVVHTGRSGDHRFLAVVHTCSSGAGAKGAGAGGPHPRGVGGEGSVRRGPEPWGTKMTILKNCHKMLVMNEIITDVSKGQ